VRPADQRGARPERQRLYDVDAAAEAAVDHDGRPAFDCCDEFPAAR
jgi:hypothetical protein